MQHWKNYEDITKYIYEKLGEESGVKIECHGNMCRVFGKSGVNHQIDVLTSHSDGIHSYKTAIECKYWDKNVNKDTVMKVAEIIEDAGINKGVIVSKKGFTPDGISYAKYKNIGLIELREVTEEDWKGRIKDIKINLQTRLPKVTGLDLIINADIQPNIQKGQNLVKSLDIISPDGTVENLHKWIDKFVSELNNQEPDVPFDKIYLFEKGTQIRDGSKNENTEIKGLKLNGILTVATEIVYIYGEEHVFMIMRSVFEEKSFTIYKDGRIIERDQNIPQ